MLNTPVFALTLNIIPMLILVLRNNAHLSVLIFRLQYILKTVQLLCRNAELNYGHIFFNI